MVGAKVISASNEAVGQVTNLVVNDDGAIEEEELAAFGLVLELFDHAVVERRAALQAGTLEPARARPR